jgi:hypothetical protein
MSFQPGSYITNNKVMLHFVSKSNLENKRKFMATKHLCSQAEHSLSRSYHKDNGWCFCTACLHSLNAGRKTNARARVKNPLPSVLCPSETVTGLGTVQAGKLSTFRSAMARPRHRVSKFIHTYSQNCLWTFKFTTN